MNAQSLRLAVAFQPGSARMLVTLDELQGDRPKDAAIKCQVDLDSEVV